MYMQLMCKRRSVVVAAVKLVVVVRFAVIVLRFYCCGHLFKFL